MKRIFAILFAASTVLAQAPASTDAIDALRGLKSVTEVGINYRDYSTRVLDAKVKVDKYLAAAPKDDAMRPKVEATMRLYVLALQAWSMKVQQKPKGSATPIAEEILASPELSSCPAMQDLMGIVTQGVQEHGEAPAKMLGFHLFISQRVLWKCAAEKLDAKRGEQ